VNDATETENGRQKAEKSIIKQ